MSLQSTPMQERPRERLIQHGVNALSVAELLAILLTTGTKGKSVLELAHEMVGHFRGLEGLLDASIEELMEIKGIGKAKAIQLKAAFGIAIKSTQSSLSCLEKISAKEAYQLVKEELSCEKREILMVILKDVKQRLISCERVSVGTLSEVLVHPREVFYPAVRHKASSLILAHNHPSGDPTPSSADLELTKHLLRSSKVMGITLDDHIIIGKHGFISLKERGLLELQR